ncbi:G-patch RNA maturation protein [Blumeria hordei DH14]|uniref:PinX1-related protein 1 n=1 Tax=Blumeria graminis f. sp. hordei (strain DH14) TaxID=546991 RepID=N1J9D5_BLUG1|nr:G-patch RNA maturation protein [Blumeria hordei DH14]
MGLAAPKKKLKLSHDPNNTRWINNTDSFGHKILTSQGWKQGEYLGARNAPHAEFHSAANSSHIRVIIKDDNLGLGAKVGTGVGHGECTGLDAFKNLLSRLNGKDKDEIDNEQRSRDNIRKAIYMEKKWGSLRFVSAGFLVGDKIEDSINKESKPSLQTSERDNKESLKTGENGSDLDENMTQKDLSRKSEKKTKRNDFQDTRVKDPTTEVKSSRKKRKLIEVSRDSTAIDAQQDRQTFENLETNLENDEPSVKKKDLKKAKKAEEKSRKKVEKKNRKELRNLNKSNPRKSNCTSPEPSVPPSMRGRHAIRSKNIAQKRMASIDVASLNQIFMIKP